MWVSYKFYYVINKYYVQKCTYTVCVCVYIYIHTHNLQMHMSITGVVTRTNINKVKTDTPYEIIH